MSIELNEMHEKADELGFERIKQLLTLALAGIAFVGGLAFAHPDPPVRLWPAAVFLGASFVFGAFFLMHSIGQLATKKWFEIYTPWLHVLAGLQFVFLAVGSVLLIRLIVVLER